MPSTDDYMYKIYFDKATHLKELLVKSETERKILEARYQHLSNSHRQEDESRLNILRDRYAEFLEGWKERNRRNDEILKSLDRLESCANTVFAKTERLKQLRKHYESYLPRQVPPWRNPASPDVSGYPEIMLQQRQLLPTMTMMVPVVTPTPLPIHSEVPKISKGIASLGEAGERMMRELNLLERVPYRPPVGNALAPPYVNYQPYNFPVIIPQYFPYALPMPTVSQPHDYKTTESAKSPSRMVRKDFQRQDSMNTLKTKLDKIKEKRASAEISKLSPVRDDPNRELPRQDSMNTLQLKLDKLADRRESVEIECLPADELQSLEGGDVFDDELEAAIAGSPMRQAENVSTYQNAPYTSSSQPIGNVSDVISVVHQQSINDLKNMLLDDPNEHVHPQDYDDDVPEDFNEQNYPDPRNDPRFQANVSRNVILEEDEEEEETPQHYEQKSYWENIRNSTGLLLRKSSIVPNVGRGMAYADNPSSIPSQMGEYRNTPSADPQFYVEQQSQPYRESHQTPANPQVTMNQIHTIRNEPIQNQYYESENQRVHGRNQSIERNNYEDGPSTTQHYENYDQTPQYRQPEPEQWRDQSIKRDERPHYKPNREEQQQHHQEYREPIPERVQYNNRQEQQERYEASPYDRTSVMEEYHREDYEGRNDSNRRTEENIHYEPKQMQPHSERSMVGDQRRYQDDQERGYHPEQHPDTSDSNEHNQKPLDMNRISQEETPYEPHIQQQRILTEQDHQRGYQDDVPVMEEYPHPNDPRQIYEEHRQQQREPFMAGSDGISYQDERPYPEAEFQMYPRDEYEENEPIQDNMHSEQRYQDFSKPPEMWEQNNPVSQFEQHIPGQHEAPQYYEETEQGNDPNVRSPERVMAERQPYNNPVNIHPNELRNTNEGSIVQSPPHDMRYEEYVGEDGGRHYNENLPNPYEDQTEIHFNNTYEQPLPQSDNSYQAMRGNMNKSQPDEGSYPMADNDYNRNSGNSVNSPKEPKLEAKAALGVRSSVVNQLLDSDSESYRVEPAGSQPADDSDFDFSIGKQ